MIHSRAATCILVMALIAPCHAGNVATSIASQINNASRYASELDDEGRENQVRQIIDGIRGALKTGDLDNVTANRLAAEAVETITPYDFVNAEQYRYDAYLASEVAAGRMTDAQADYFSAAKQRELFSKPTTSAQPYLPPPPHPPDLGDVFQVIGNSIRNTYPAPPISCSTQPNGYGGALTTCR